MCVHVHTFLIPKISTFKIREENERRIVNGSNYPNTSHDITYSDILLESRIEKSERSRQFYRYLVVCAPRIYSVGDKCL